jgi:hypothetical protein
MSTQTVEFRAATGLTITAKLFAAGSDTEVASVAATEATNRKGTYSAAFTSIAAGEYQLIAFDPQPIPVASWWVTLTLTTATFGTYSKSDTRDINTRALDIQSRIPTSLDGGNMRSSVQSMAPNVLNAAALASDAVTEIQSGLATTVAVAAAFTEIKGAGWSAGTDTLEEIADAIAGISSGTGGGARTVTITVTLNSNPVEGATVRLTKSAETYTGTTNASGVVTFNVDDGTWTVAITAANAEFAGDELVVDGNETQTYTLTATSITPSSTGLVTGYWVCYSHVGVVESGVSITMICKKVPAESGFALDSATRTATSGANGIAQFANLIPGATYQVARGSGQNFIIKVPDDATGTIELNSILGT